MEDFPMEALGCRRVILHVDMNCFYANVECQEHPELRDKPVVVGGDEEARHGIVLAKNQVAKRWGIKTAETLWQARKKCPDLVVMPPNYQLYLKVSRLARRIYLDYSDLVEPFGPDEAWIDITGSTHLTSKNPQLAAWLTANEISERVKAELGLTVSVGVSWNKIFAKFGSDYRKPDAITVITPYNYRSLVWRAPADELLYVGRATRRKLHASAIETIGDIAHASTALLARKLGKNGLVLREFARGRDITPVRPYAEALEDVDRPIKSYGNGMTSPFDITCDHDAKALTWMLAESVAQRLREGRARARTIDVSVRSADDLGYRNHQMTLPRPTDLTQDVAQTAWTLMRAIHTFDEEHPVRGLHVRASNLVPASEAAQMAFFDIHPQRVRAERLDHAMDELRGRFGNMTVVRGTALASPRLRGIDVKADNIVHPQSFFH